MVQGGEKRREGVRGEVKFGEDTFWKINKSTGLFVFMEESKKKEKGQDRQVTSCTFLFNLLYSW